MLYMMRYILWVAARLGAGNVIQDGCQNYPKLDIIMPKTREIENFDAKHKENDTTKYFTAFCQHFVLFNPRTYKQPCIRQLRPRYERQSKPWCPVSVLGYGRLTRSVTVQNATTENRGNPSTLCL